MTSDKIDTIKKNALNKLRTFFKKGLMKVDLFLKIAVRSLSSFRLSVIEFISNFFIKIKNTPKWVSSRPEAFIRWRKADKKKKKYRSFHLQKRIKPEPRYVPTAKELIKQTLQFIFSNFRVLAGIALLHSGLYVLLVNVSPAVDVETLQKSVSEVFGGSSESVSSTAVLVGTVLGSPRQIEGGGFAVTFLIISASLMYVWSTRERMNEIRIKSRDAIFNGLAPIVSAFVILIYIGLQLIPFGIATFFYTSARAGSFFANGFEDILFFCITFFVGVASVYLLTSSIVALYATTLPGVYPLKALKAAKGLVSFRRLTIFKRVMALVIFVILAYLFLLFAIVRFAPTRTYLYIDIFQIAVVPFVNIYLYKLYRSLL